MSNTTKQYLSAYNGRDISEQLYLSYQRARADSIANPSAVVTLMHGMVECSGNTMSHGEASRFILTTGVFEELRLSDRQIQKCKDEMQKAMEEDTEKLKKAVEGIDEKIDEREKEAVEMTKRLIQKKIEYKKMLDDIGQGQKEAVGSFEKPKKKKAVPRKPRFNMGSMVEPGQNNAISAVRQRAPPVTAAQPDTIPLACIQQEPPQQNSAVVTKAASGQARQASGQECKEEGQEGPKGDQEGCHGC